MQALQHHSILTRFHRGLMYSKNCVKPIFQVNQICVRLIHLKQNKYLVLEFISNRTSILYQVYISYNKYSVFGQYISNNKYSVFGQYISNNKYSVFGQYISNNKYSVFGQYNSNKKYLVFGLYLKAEQVML